MTVTLLAFLVILLVGLATYTRIETAVAGNTQRQAQARQNALLALNVALGQLQKSAGPDQRVTATAESVTGVNAQKAHYTGVWDSTTARTTPLTWLVSGSENGTSVNVTAATPTAQAVELVGAHTSGTANDVIAPLVNVKTYGVPGQFANDNTTTGGTTIGRYAWWVGDQGVKAPVAIADRTAAVNYAPWDSAELNRRLRQQMGLGAGPADANGNAVFEPRDTATGSPTNAALTTNTTSFNQLAFFNKPAGGTVGLATLQQNYHAWSPNNFAVLANTKLGGLRQDLSLKPDLLGSAFAAWADYDGSAGHQRYMEDPAAPATPTPLPAYETDPIRRRYYIGRTPPVTDSGFTHKVAPILSVCLLNFNLQAVSSTVSQSRLRFIIGLWNPYSSALVPEPLRLEVTGLPSSADFVNGAGATLGSVRLADSPLVIDLPWEYGRTDLAGQPDAQSWLPGRVYYWLSNANNAPPNTGFLYRTNITGFAANIVRQSSTAFSASTNGIWRINSNRSLTIKLFRGTDSIPLATYTTPEFPASFSNSAAASSGTAQFTYFVRLDQNKPGPTPAALETWLTSANRDPREISLPSESLTSGPSGLTPSLYSGNPTSTLLGNDDLLLERAMSNAGQSYNEDVPVFELPRSPLVSLGELQHLNAAGERPFSVGNSWGGSGGKALNAIFDAYFFSGLTASTTINISAKQPLPNALLQVTPRKADGTSVTTGDVILTSGTGYSSKFFLQGGAFNLNSVTAGAWLAVLRSGRFVAPRTFTYLAPDTATGTATDGTITTIADSAALANDVFFRFAQSAQETQNADDYLGADIATAFGPAVVSQAPTHLFRRGMRALSATQSSALANAMAIRVGARLNLTGPFRTTQEFLNEGIIEAAIADAALNLNEDGSQMEFSSQFLTQGDIMTALAPVLFPRSDTFVIRSYGEAVNPTTGATEGKAWCEATVQRVPEYFDKAADAEEVAPAALTGPLNQTYGRRFKVVSFRWLTHSDI